MAQKTMLHFNGKWRSYQKRILDNINDHLKDNKLHVVAAPGAGKTTLGIEVIARLNRAALILCPTNTIKNQWRERICSSFLEEQYHGLVSTNIREPGFITVITYQALLAAFSEEDLVEGDESSSAKPGRIKSDKADVIIGTLKRAKISLLCFDEAHHLRNEWWKALTYLDEHLKPEQTLALTATPPYDVDAAEWKRYQELCGDIDEVISIPELVKNGDLCPHQDFIHFSLLRQEEREMVRQHTEHVKQMMETIKGDRELLDALAAMSILSPDESEMDQILDDTEYYVSVASLLRATGYKIPTRFLNLFDAKQNDIPSFDVKKASTFLNGFLFPKSIVPSSSPEGEGEELEPQGNNPCEVKRTQYLNLARRLGLVANNKVVLTENKNVQRQIAGSLGKLDSIVEIVRLEHEQLGSRLRMVVLTDFIRLEDTACTSLGVVPIWRKLTETFGGAVAIGVLCGSLILLPEGTVGHLHQLLAANSIAEDAVTLDRFADAKGFVRVVPKESVKNHIVRLITEMFNAGDVTVLVGTQALLGEGWDAPSINSLILSSTVSSYMLSNQMRGRAIRIDKDNPDKVSNIWHLATVDIPTLQDYLLLNFAKDELDATGIYTYDLDQLATRFEGFEAPSYYGTHDIQSGIERITEQPQTAASPSGDKQESFKQKIERLKTLTLQLSRNRETTRKWWKESLYLGYGNKRVQLSTGVTAEEMTVKSLLYTDYRYILYSVVPLLSAAYYLLVNMPSVITLAFFVIVLLVSAVVAIKALFKFLRTGTVSRLLRQIAIVILEAMSNQGVIKSSIKRVGLSVHEQAAGASFVSCCNLPADENNLFIQALREFLDPIDNPRYLLVRHSSFKGFFKQTDYFSIPAVISPNKKSVDEFAELWKKYIGPCEIVYTRNVEGRKLLLKARKDAFSATKRKKSKRLSKWQ